jgi:hypothetical protein
MKPLLACNELRPECDGDKCVRRNVQPPVPGWPLVHCDDDVNVMVSG